MPTKVSIFNETLYLLGKPRITNPSQSVELTDIYETQRDLVLRAHPWNFAQEFYTVSNDATAGSWKYTYTYTLPTDPLCLRVIALEDPKAKFFIGNNRKLHTDVGSPLKFIGIARVTAESRFTADFATTLSTRMAYVAGSKLTSIEKSRREELKEDYGNQLAEARSIDGQEGQFLEFTDGDYLDARI